MPESFGIMALVLSIFGVVSLFLSFSINMSYIYLPESDTLFSSALLLSVMNWFVLLLISSIAYIPLQSFYGSDIASFVLIISFFKLFGALSEVSLAQMEKKVDFTFSTLLTGFGGPLALGLAVLAAFLGMDIYSLLLREVLTPIFVFLLIRVYAKQRLDFKNYDVEEMKALFNYSFKMLFSRGSELLYVKIPFIVIATYLDKNILGYLSQMYYLANLLNAALSTFNAKVAFVFFSQFKDDKEKSKKGLLYINMLNLFMGIPIFVIFYFFPVEILSFLWGEKWVPGAEYLQMFSLFALLLPIFNSLKAYFYGHGKNSIVTRSYIGGLLVYLMLIALWPTNIMFSLAFSLSMVVMLLFMMLKIVR